MNKLFFVLLIFSWNVCAQTVPTGPVGGASITIKQSELKRPLKCFAVQTCKGKLDGVYDPSSYAPVIKEINTYSYKILVGQAFPTSEKIKASNVARYLNQEKSCNNVRHRLSQYNNDPSSGIPYWHEDSRAMSFKLREVCIPTIGAIPLLDKNPCESNSDCPNSNYRCNNTTGMCYSLIVSESNTYSPN